MKDLCLRGDFEKIAIGVHLARDRGLTQVALAADEL